MNLRPYQQQARKDIHKGFLKYKKQLAVLPTGAGKTILFSALAKDYHAKGLRTLILANQRKLIEQAAEKLQKSTGIFAQAEMAELSASLSADAVVGSVQTMQGARLLKWPKNHFGLVVADEADLSIAPEFQNVLNHFDAHILGVTATPDRGDKKNLGQFYENKAYEIGLFELIKQGYLSRITVKSVPLQIDMNAVKSKAGDFDLNDTACAIEPYLGAIAKAIKEHASFRKTMVFLPLISTSKKMVEFLEAEGLSARHVDGTSKDQDDILKAFTKNEFEVLCNAMLLTRGYDEPEVDCIVNLRITKSRSLYSQIVGRGTRVIEGKQDLLLLDFIWQHEKHNLIRPAHLVAKNDETARAMTEKAQVTQEALDLAGLESDVVSEREKKLKEALAAQAKRKARSVDAMEFALSLHDVDLAEYEAEMGWETSAATVHQISFLERFGINTETIKNRGHATKLISAIILRRKNKLATPKQLKHLIALGHPTPHQATFAEAKQFLDERWNQPAVTQ